MNIDWVIPCRFVEVHDNLGTIVGAGIDTFWLPELPAPVQVAVAVRLSALPEELASGVKHSVRNIITGPNGDEISEVTGEFEVDGGERIERPDWLQGVIVSTLIQFQAEVAGTYTFEHVVDQSSKSVPLHIVHGLPPGAVPPPE